MCKALRIYLKAKRELKPERAAIYQSRMRPHLRRFFGGIMRHALIAIVVLALGSIIDPLGMRSESTMLVRNAVDRIFRMVPPWSAIWDWEDERVRPMANKVAEGIARMQGEEVPEGGFVESELGEYLSVWTPIHMIMFDEVAVNTGRRQRDLDGAVMGIPLEDVTELLRYLADQGVSVIFIDIRFISEFSYSGDFCREEIPKWQKIVRRPGAEPREGDDKRPYLIVAGHAPLVTERTSEILWQGPPQSGLLPPLIERETRHTVRPCLSEAALVVQTNWRPVLGSYPVTVNRHYDPFRRASTAGKGNRWRYAPAVEMLRAWCLHDRSVVKDLKSCAWAGSLETPARHETPLALDWVHMMPAIYDKNLRKRCKPKGEPVAPRDDARVIEQTPHPWTQWLVIVADMVEQFVLQTLIPVGNRDDRVAEPQCILPPQWDGWLSALESPEQWNSAFLHSLYGSAVIVGTAYENGSDWHPAPTANLVPGARLHGVALQSLMWRGGSYLHDYAAVDPLNPVFFLEVAMTVLAIYFFELLKGRPDWWKQYQPFGLPDRHTADTAYVLILFQLLFVLLSAAGWAFARFVLHAPVPDVLAIGFGLIVTYSVELVKHLSTRRNIVLEIFCAPRVFIILFVICGLLIPTAIALSGCTLCWQLWLAAMAFFGGPIVLIIALAYDLLLVPLLEKHPKSSKTFN